MRRKIGVEICVYSYKYNDKSLTKISISTLFGREIFSVAGQFNEKTSTVDLIMLALNKCSDLSNLSQEVAEALNTTVVKN
jgi:hypothetical protein